MGKSLVRFLAVMMVTIMSLGFASCSKEENKNKPEKEDVSAIIGTWKCENNNWSDIYTFKTDGTFKLVWFEGGVSGEESGTWMYDTINNKLTINTIRGEKLGARTYDIFIQGNRMSLSYVYYDEFDGPTTDTRIFLKQ